MVLSRFKKNKVKNVLELKDKFSKYDENLSKIIKPFFHSIDFHPFAEKLEIKKDDILIFNEYFSIAILHYIVKNQINSSNGNSLFNLLICEKSYFEFESKFEKVINIREMFLSTEFHLTRDSRTICGALCVSGLEERHHIKNKEMVLIYILDCFDLYINEFVKCNDTVLMPIHSYLYFSDEFIKYNNGKNAEFFFRFKQKSDVFLCFLELLSIHTNNETILKNAV